MKCYMFKIVWIENKTNEPILIELGIEKNSVYEFDKLMGINIIFKCFQFVFFFLFFRIVCVHFCFVLFCFFCLFV